MKLKVFSIFLLLTTVCVSQTKVGKIQFNDIDVFDDTELMLNGAGAKDKTYCIGLYLNFEVDGVEDGIKVAEKDADMALTIKTMTNTDKQDLKEMVRVGLERATDGNSYVLEDNIRDFLNLLPGQVDRYEIYKILYSKKDQTMSVFRNKTKLGVIEKSLPFKKAFFKIWLGNNPVDSALKEDMLGSGRGNPFLGKWKTYEKETGVARSIVQLYIIKNKLFGAVDQMLRESERDAICYKCPGQDKNLKVEGLVIIKDLVQKDETKYVDGTYTDVFTGDVSPLQVWIEEENPDILNVRYRGGGGTHEWKRIENDAPSNREEYQTVKKM